MTIPEFLEALDKFVMERQHLSKEDDDGDTYRSGYRAGYYDAVVYFQDWMEEEFG